VKTAVVTGAGRGMGRETARRLAARGYQVLVTDVNEASARETAEQIGGGAWARAQDVADPESHREAARAASERGRLEVWVNNAGVLRTEKAWDHPDADVRLIVEANLLGVMWGSRAAVEAMRDDPEGTHIVNMASMASFGPVPGLAVYGATKHGVLAFTESLQGDLRLSGIPIRLHAVCPDLVDTGMMREHAGNPEYALGFSGNKVYTPEEISDEIVKLLDSDRMILAIPRNRMWLARTTHLFPRAGLPLAKFIRALGERKRQKLTSAG
jgi:NAD(P)-dependent dehydrogenase (short-subunit alcohol dehydrogenase family)